MLTVIQPPLVSATEGTVYTDGATQDNPGPSGYGVHGFDSNGFTYNIWAALSVKASNNRAEMMGYITALRLAIRMGWKRLTVYTDSKYVIDGATKRMRRQAANDWHKPEGGLVPNNDLWKIMIQEEDTFRAAGGTVTLKWVKGHSGVPGNEAADKLAVTGRLAAEKGEIIHNVEVLPPEGKTATGEKEKPAKKKPSDYPRLLAGRRFMFVTKTKMRTEDGWSIYMSNTYDDKKGMEGRYCGAPDADNLQSVVVMKDPVPQIEAIIEYQNSITPDDYNTPVVGMLDRIVRPDTWSMLTEHGKALLRHQRLNVLTAEKEPLTEYRRPPRLAFYEIDRFQVLLDYLEEYRSNKLKSEHRFDVTDWIYGRDKKKKQKLHSNVGGQEKYVTVPVEVHGRQIPLKLTIGLDIPPRVNLSGLVKQHDDIKVSVVLYAVTPTAFRYAVVFEATDHYAIYASMAANFKPITRTSQAMPTPPVVPAESEVEDKPKPKRKKKKKAKSTKAAD